jgi:hypothetical protein
MREEMGREREEGGRATGFARPQANLRRGGPAIADLVRGSARGGRSPLLEEEERG